MVPRPSLMNAPRVRERGARGAAFLLSAMLLLPTGACVALPSHKALAATTPIFSPQGFFAGQTRGDGVLRIALSHARPVHVRGEGHLETDGTLVLVQRVTEGDKTPRTRTWHLHPAGTGQFSGTLSDAIGPVTADVQGNRLHLQFTAKGGLRIEQWLYLQPGGQIALNRMIVRKFGVRVAALSETIRRVP